MITMPTVNQHAAWIGLKCKSQSSLVSLSVKTKMEDIEKALTGKDVSLETRQRLSVAAKRRWAHARQSNRGTS